MTQLSTEDRRWLDAAVRYAMPFAGTTADVPGSVALLVDPQTQTLVARSTTARGGRPHAEAEAIAKAGFEAAGCTLYVTIEPCHHWGRTPPCVDAIIRAGIMRVVIGTLDPDLRTAGGSLAQLESAGIEAVLANHRPSQALHAGHALRHRAQRPFVTAVMIVSADGMIGQHGATRAAIAGSEAAAWIDLLRTRSEAVLIGAATARSDEAELAVGLPDLASRTPLRLVLAGASGVDRQVNLIGGFSGYRTAVVAESNSSVDAPASVEIIRVAGNRGRPDLAAALQVLAQRNVQNLLVESGRRLTTALLEADLIDRFALVKGRSELGENAVSASLDGPIEDALAAAGLAEVDRQVLGDDNLTLYERQLLAV